MARNSDLEHSRFQAEMMRILPNRALSEWPTSHRANESRLSDFAVNPEEQIIQNRGRRELQFTPHVRVPAPLPLPPPPRRSPRKRPASAMSGTDESGPTSPRRARTESEENMDMDEFKMTQPSTSTSSSMSNSIATITALAIPQGSPKRRMRIPPQAPAESPLTKCMRSIPASPLPVVPIRGNASLQRHIHSFGDSGDTSSGQKTHYYSPYTMKLRSHDSISPSSELGDDSGIFEESLSSSVAFSPEETTNHRTRLSSTSNDSISGRSYISASSKSSKSKASLAKRRLML